MTKQELIKYLNNELNDADSQRIGNWINENESNRAYFNSLKEIWIIAALPEERASETDFNEFDKKYKFTKFFSGKRILPYASIAVAVIAIFITIGIVFMHKEPDKEYLSLSNTTTELQVKELPDGSIIALSPNSELLYDKQYGATNRDILLNGNCYFNVSKNISLPMHIQVGKDLNITVTGTKFYANSSPSNSNMFELALTEGTVSVKLKKHTEAIELSVGDFLQVDEHQSYTTTTISEDISIMKDMANYLNFKNTKMSLVIKRLSELYKIRFQTMNSQVLDYLFTADLNDNSIEEILSIFKVTMGIDSKIENDIIYLY